MIAFYDIGLNSRKVRTDFLSFILFLLQKVIIPSVIGRSGHFLQDMDVCDRNYKRSYPSLITSPFFIQHSFKSVKAQMGH